VTPPDAAAERAGGEGSPPVHDAASEGSGSEEDPGSEAGDEFAMPEEEEWRDPSDGGVLSQVFEAAEAGQAEALAELLQRLSVDVDTRGEDGDSALHLACLYGREECAERLLAAGASPTAVDGDGGTPLHDAAAGGHLGIVRRLMEAGAAACVNVADHDGETPLHTGARGGHAEIVTLLLAAGADPSVTNAAGNIPEQEARGVADETVLQILRDANSAA